MNTLSRRDFLKGLAGAAALPLVGCQRLPQVERPGQPLNVVMIAIDDMNNWVGAMGGRAKTPNIDRLARQGVLFTNAHCVVACCNPSRTALWTGLRPETTGQFGNDGCFRNREGGQQIVTMAQHFRANGYETAAAGKLFHQPAGVGAQPHPVSDPQSWDRQHRGWIGTSGHDLYVNDNGMAKWHNGKFTGYLGQFCLWGPCPEKKEETGDWQSADYCAQYLGQAHDKPFFLSCGLFRPHSPQLAPQEFFDMYPLESIVLPEAPADDFNDIPQCAQSNFSSEFFLKGVRDMGQWKQAVQGYLASMSFADACVGHLLDALDKSQYRDNTVVVLWTDHGWHLGDKHRWEKYSLWKQVTNAPLIIKAPGVTRPGGVCRRAVSFLDLYPSLSEACGLPLRPELEGHSLLPLLRKPKAAWPHAAVTSDYYTQSYSVACEQWNYIRYEDGSEELYDHDADPMELKNLAADPRHGELKRKLAGFIPTPRSHPQWRTPAQEREVDAHMPPEVTQVWSKDWVKPASKKGANIKGLAQVK